jgi:hypothetical protein
MAFLRPQCLPQWWFSAPDQTAHSIKQGETKKQIALPKDQYRDIPRNWSRITHGQLHPVAAVLRQRALRPERELQNPLLRFDPEFQHYSPQVLTAHLTARMH